jgi:hypothetical protein
MPTVLTAGNVRVVIYTNDHPPPHVHVVRGNDARARFELNCPEGPVGLIDHDGFRLAEINRLGGLIADDLERICAMWSAIHG